jgi:hypothetical protein
MTTNHKKLRKRMQAINVNHRAYFIKNDNNIRLCHLEQGRYKYLTFPYCDCKAMTAAAQVLKECGIVDGYRMEQLSETFFYVVLIRHKYERHTDSTGVPVIARLTKVVEWSELSLTRADVKQFIARFEIAKPTTARVIHMHPHNNNTKRTA